MVNFPFKNIIINSKIKTIARTCDMVYISFLLTNSKLLHIHAQCFIRVFDNKKLIICTQDMLRRSEKLKKNQKFDWSKTGNTLFDDTINEFKDKLCSQKVETVNFCEGDLIIYLTNNVRLDILVHITESDDPNYSENYRIIEDDESKPHFIV